MLKTLLCRTNLGHHRVAEADRDVNVTRHCVYCGKVDPRGTRRPERLFDSDHPTYAVPFTPPDSPGGY